MEIQSTDRTEYNPLKTGLNLEYYKSLFFDKITCDFSKTLKNIEYSFLSDYILSENQEELK